MKMFLRSKKAHMGTAASGLSYERSEQPSHGIDEPAPFA
jgi:hypothetical protein